MVIKTIIRRIPALIIIFTGIVGFQTISIYERNLCYAQLNRKVSHCKLIKKLTFPGRFLYKGFAGVKKLLTNKYPSVLLVQNIKDVRSRFDNLNSGFSFNYPQGTRKNAGFLLLSGADPLNNGEPLIELWDLNKQELVYKWVFDIDQFIKKSGLNISKDDLFFWHPLLLNDGNLSVIADNSTLVKFSSKGEVIKVNREYKFHHTQEIDKQGKIYVPINNQRYSLQSKGRNPKHGINEGFAILDQDLEVLKTYSMEEIYQNSGLNYKINYGALSGDPFHINDVEPLIDDVESKVVLLSLRHKSAIIAFDLLDEKILWILEGYGKYQHDVDFVDNKENIISIFDNNTTYQKDGSTKSEGNIFTIISNLPYPIKSEKQKLLIFNYGSNDEKEQGLVIEKERFDTLETKLIPKTAFEGLSEYISENESIFVEETAYGRLLEFNQKRKELLWQYVNRNNSNNLYYRMQWSRRMKSISPDILNYLKN